MQSLEPWVNFESLTLLDALRAHEYSHTSCSFAQQSKSIWTFCCIFSLEYLSSVLWPVICRLETSRGCLDYLWLTCKYFDRKQKYWTSHLELGPVSLASFGWLQNLVHNYTYQAPSQNWVLEDTYCLQSSSRQYESHLSQWKTFSTSRGWQNL